MERFIKEKRFIILVRKVDETYVFEKAVEIKSKYFAAKTYPIAKKRDIPINQSKPTYQKKLKKFYFHDVVTGAPLPFIPQDAIISPEQMNTLLNDKLIRDLHASMGEPKLPIKDIILYIAVGAGVMGFVMMILVYTGVL